jgi:hypothetical protein
MKERLTGDYEDLFDDIEDSLEKDWDPNKHPVISRKETITINKENKTMNKTEKVINETKSAINETKKTIVKMQKGKAVLSAVKTSLINTPGVPVQVRDVLSMEGYGDLVTGLLLNIVSNSLTSNESIISASRDANFVGSVEFSNQFTFFEKLIENAINGVSSKLENIVDNDNDCYCEKGI